MESVAIFEAKFDPPTLAHVEILKALKRHVDEIVVSVRADEAVGSFEHRYSMAELVCRDEGV
jgi:cytidyltransferase-like protein